MDTEDKDDKGYCTGEHIYVARGRCDGANCEYSRRETGAPVLFVQFPSVFLHKLFSLKKIFP